MGVDAFLDVEEINGDRFHDVIQREIIQREYFLVILSPSSLESEWVCREVEMALKCKPTDKIIPLYTPGFDPSAHIPDELAALRDIGAIDYEYKSSDQAFKRISKALGVKPWHKFSRLAPLWLFLALLLVVAIILLIGLAPTLQNEIPRIVFGPSGTPTMTATATGTPTLTPTGTNTPTQTPSPTPTPGACERLIQSNEDDLFEACQTEVPLMTPVAEQDYLELGYYYLRAEKWRTAISHFDEVLAVNPDSIPASLGKCIAQAQVSGYPGIYEDNKMYYLDYDFSAKTFSACSRAIELAPDAPETAIAYDIRASMYFLQYNCTAAEADLEQALIVDPDIEGVSAELNTIYRIRRNYVDYPYCRD